MLYRMSVPSFYYHFSFKRFRATVRTLKILENLPFLKSEASIFLDEAVLCLCKHNPVTTEG